MTPLTYLCGPINGCTDDEATNWRELAKQALGAENCIDPMRRDYRGIENANVAKIVNGDLDDIDTCDIVLANCWHASWGTAMEIHYAYECCKMVIAVVPPGTSVSPWLTYHASLITDSLTDALGQIQRMDFTQ